MRRDFLSEGDPAAGERPQGVFRGRGRRLEGPRAETGAAPKQALIGEAVEFATLTWVDWFNTRRLLGPLGDIPPAEFEAQYYEQAAVA